MKNTFVRLLIVKKVPAIEFVHLYLPIPHRSSHDFNVAMRLSPPYTTLCLICGIITGSKIIHYFDYRSKWVRNTGWFELGHQTQVNNCLLFCTFNYLSQSISSVSSLNYQSRQFFQAYISISLTIYLITQDLFVSQNG